MRFFVLLFSKVQMHRGCTRPLGLRTLGFFLWLCIICYLWGLFVVRPQGYLEVASVGVCALGFYLFLVPLVGRASAWQVTQSPAKASQVGARAFYVILVMAVT